MNTLAIEVFEQGQSVGRITLPASALAEPVVIGSNGLIRLDGLVAEHARLLIKKNRVYVAAVSPQGTVRVQGQFIQGQWTEVKLPGLVELGAIALGFADADVARALSVPAPVAAPPGFPTAPGYQTLPSPGAPPAGFQAAPPAFQAAPPGFQNGPGFQSAPAPGLQTAPGFHAPPPGFQTAPGFRTAPGFQTAPGGAGPAPFPAAPSAMSSGGQRVAPPTMPPPTPTRVSAQQPAERPANDATEPQLLNPSSVAASPHTQPGSVASALAALSSDRVGQSTMASAHQPLASVSAPAATPGPMLAKPALPPYSRSESDCTQIATLEEIRAAAAARGAPTKGPSAVPAINAPSLNRDLHVKAPPPPTRGVKAFAGRLAADWKKSSILIRAVGIIMPVFGLLFIAVPLHAQDDDPANAAATNEAANPNGNPATAGTATSTSTEKTVDGLKSAVGTAVGIDVGQAKEQPKTAKEPPKSDPRDTIPIVAEGAVALNPREMSMHRQTMNALFSGDYATAMTLASQLAQAHPESSTYRDVLRVLYSKSKNQRTL